MNSRIIIDEHNFDRILDLHLNYEWLNFQRTALLELWALTDCEDEKELIEFLIRNFCYVNGNTLNQASVEFVQQIESVWKLTAENTIITAICDNSNPDGSQMLIQIMKNKFSIHKGWRENNFSNSIAVTAYEKLKDNYVIVIVDDFVGTGQTLIRKYKWLLGRLEKQKLKGISIKVLSLASMEFSKEGIENMGIDHYSSIWLKKGISELALEDNIERYTKAMENLENKLNKKVYGKDLPYFGYKRSESLFAFENTNIPNNVFPIFWWPELIDNLKRTTIFRRIF